MAFPFGFVSPKRMKRKKAEVPPPRSRDASKPSGGGRLVFDPLEPRVLLSADVLALDLSAAASVAHDHDLLVQMVTDTLQVGTTTQRVQRIDIVDRANGGALLAVGDLAKISSVTIKDGAAKDSVTIDANSFAGKALPSFTIAGGGGADSLTIKHAAGTTLTWSLGADKSGTVSGAVNVKFAGIGAITGGAGTDTLVGPSSDTQWRVAGAGAGGVAGVKFVGFENLTGAANNKDTFSFLPGGSLAGAIDGGAGGFDTLVLGGKYKTVVSSPTDGSSGVITADGAAIRYSGLEPITLTGASTDVVIDLGGLDASATLTAGPAGQLTFAAPGASETQTFANPTGSLTIKLSGLGDDLDIQSLDPGFAAKLTVSGAKFAGNKVDVSTNVSTGGGDLSISADTIDVHSNVRLATASASGDAGAITLDGKTITVETGATLDATAVAGHEDGEVTLTAKDTAFRNFLIPIFYFDKTVGITVTGATIKGGAIDLESEASDLSLPSETPSYAKGLAGNLATMLAQVPGVLISKFTGVDASVIIRGANASTTVTDTNIVSSGSVNIKADTDVETSVNAISVATNKFGFQVAVGYGQATSTVTAAVKGTSTILAKDNVTVEADGTTQVKSVARATTNITGAVDKNATSIAVALGYTNLTDTAEVDSGAKITATLGSVNVGAVGKNKTGTDASTVGFVDAKAGVSVGIGVDISNVNSYINGQITAGGTKTGSAAASFDPSQAGFVSLDATGPLAGVLNIPGHELKTGDTVVYNAQSNSGGAAAPIGGLQNGASYTVTALNDHQLQLSRGPAIALDGTVTDPGSVQTLTQPAASTFSLDAVDSGAKSIRLVNHGFADGDTVAYNSNGNAVIQGLASGANYKVHVIDATQFQLLDSSNNPIAVSQGAALGLQSFTDGANVQSIILGKVDANAKTITLPGHGFANGQTVNYSSLEPDGTLTIGGLQNATDNTVANATANTFQLIDPATHQIVALTDPGNSLQAFVYTGKVLSFAPHGAVDSTSGTLYLPNHGLQTGDVLVYQIDPNLTHTVQVPVQGSLPFSLDAIDPGAKAITLNNNGFTEGDTVTYSANGNPTITGLTEGGNYVVHLLSADGSQFQLIDPTTNATIAVSQGAATGRQTFTDGSIVASLTLAKIDTTANAIDIAEHGLTNGEQVSYGNLNTPVGGLTDSATYTVRVLSADAFQLVDSTGHTVTLSDPGPTTHSLAFASAPSTISAADQEIGGLQQGANYYVVRIDADHIRLAATPNEAPPPSPSSSPAPVPRRPTRSRRAR